MGMPQEGLERERRASREGGDSTLSLENAISDLGIGLGSDSAFSLSPGRGLDEQGDPFSNLTLSLQIKAAIGQEVKCVLRHQVLAAFEGICKPRLGRGMP